MASTQTLCTFGFLGRVTAHSLSAVEAIRFDGVQMQRLGVLTNAVDLISDPVQGYYLPLRRTKQRQNHKL